MLKQVQHDRELPELFEVIEIKETMKK